MKKHYLISLFLFLHFFSALANTNALKNTKPISILWEMGANEIEPGYYENTFYVINNTSDILDNNWVVYFCQKQSVPRKDIKQPLIIDKLSPTYYKIYPSGAYKPIASGDTLKMTFRSRGNIIKSTAAPEGSFFVHLDETNNQFQPIDIKIQVKPFTLENQWSRKNANELPYPSANITFDENIKYQEKIDLDKTYIFPSIKSVEKLAGDFIFSRDIQLNTDSAFTSEANLLKIKLEELYHCTISAIGNTIINLKKSLNKQQNDEYYQIQFNNGIIDIIGSDAHAIFNGTQTLLAILRNGKLPISLPNMTINDYPDMAHRGLMLDVARNFTTKENILKLIDILSMYKMSFLHLHLTDDEGWRIEILGLEELTDVGSRRGFTEDESSCIFPAYGGGWDANNHQSVANGYYSREDFIEILRYAKKRHITIIPEVDLPGHARAAIVSMNARYQKYKNINIDKAEEYLLTEEADTSKYISAQSYTDNVINVALPSTYRFVEKVISEIELMYNDAGLKLTVFHLGGDEVSRGAWEGSPAAKRFMTANNIKEIRGLKDYFVTKSLNILNEKDMQLGAWQEVALLPNKEVNPKFANQNILSYCWNTIPEWKGDEIPYKLANSHYPIILCNISNFYFDLAYNKHQDEPEAYWAGFVNEYNSYNMLPYDIYKSVDKKLNGTPIDITKASDGKQALHPYAYSEIIGIQGQLWSETIRSFDMIEYYLFPKMYGLIERSWNNEPAWSKATEKKHYENALLKYNTKISRIGMKQLSILDVNFRIPHPGLKIIDGQLYANSAIADASIYYTIDGSEPTTNSTIWTEPINCNSKLIKAKTFYLSKESVTTNLNQ